MAKRQGKIENIWHPMVRVDFLRAFVDIHVLPDLRVLWANNIQTFYSCQGGPCSRNIKTGKIHHQLAYVQVYETDCEQVKELLWFRNPKIDRIKKNDTRVHRDRNAVRFDPSPDAMNIPLLGDSSILGHPTWY